MMDILIIKLSALGDAVMASTLLPELRKRYPGARITWLCGTEIAQLVKLFQGIDKVLAVDNSLLKKGTVGRIRFVLAAWRLIAGKRYDLCITGHTDKRWKILSRVAFCKRRVSFDGGRAGPIAGRYFGTEYARLAAGEDGSIEQPFPLGTVETAPSKESRGMVLLLPGGAKNLMNDNPVRRWPGEHYRRLAELLLKEGIPVGVIGSNGDKWAEPFFDGLDVSNYIGKTDISGLLNLIAGAGAVVSHDSGPMHLAYLAGTPLVALTGPLNHSTSIPPGAENVALPQVSLPCAPCYDGKQFAQRCRENICMIGLAPETVLDAVKKVYRESQVK